MNVNIPILFVPVCDIPIPMIGQRCTFFLESPVLKNSFEANLKLNSTRFFIVFTEANTNINTSRSLLCDIVCYETHIVDSTVSLSVTVQIHSNTVDIRKEPWFNETTDSVQFLTYLCFGKETLDSILEADNAETYYPPHLIQDAEHLFEHFTSSDKFNNIAPELLISKIKSDLNVHDKINLLADYLLQSRVDRLDYIQAETPAIRYVLLLKAMNDYLKDSNGSNSVDWLSTKTPTENPPKPKTVRRRLSKKSTPNATKKKTKVSWREKVENSLMPEDIKEKIMREVVKAEKTPAGSTEHAQVTDYLRWALDVPWGSNTYKNVDLKSLRENLDGNHYGLNEVKEHLVELMCLQELKNENTGSVLCFIGPAGTGKTTIAKSIAANSNRPVIHIALGGLTDVTEFRGYRRTYIAARPGRLISEVINKKSLAPLIILDEIDKMQAVKGDPSAALLEILDPEQNANFTDHYLEIPVDLSKAMFICTANYENQIPAPLKDRMELIRFRSYSSEERDIITRQFVMPKVLKECNPTNLPVSFEEDAIVEIIKIVQIRQIEKLIAKLIRRGVTQVHVYDADSYTITKDEVLKIKDNYKEESKKKPLGF